MKKRKVLRFALALGAFALLIASLQLLLPIKVTGASTAVQAGTSNQVVKVNIESYDHYKDVLRVTYTIINQYAQVQQVLLKATLLAPENVWVVEGSQMLVLTPSSQEQYSILLQLPSHLPSTADLILQVSDDATTAQTQQTVRLAPSFKYVTGLVTAVSYMQKASGLRIETTLALVTLFTMLLISILKKSMSRKKSAPYRSPLDRFITLDLKDED